MHEMGIAAQLVEVAVSSIPEDMKGVKIECVNVQVGKLSSVVADSLKFCFEIAIKDTPIDGATIHIEEIPVTAKCKACKHTWTLDEPAFRCPECQSESVDILTGRELDVVSMDVAD